LTFFINKISLNVVLILAASCNKKMTSRWTKRRKVKAELEQLMTVLAKCKYGDPEHAHSSTAVDSVELPSSPCNVVATEAVESESDISYQYEYLDAVDQCSDHEVDFSDLEPVHDLSLDYETDEEP
jgi:hypothetical protein